MLKPETCSLKPSPTKELTFFENRHKASGAVGTYEDDDWDFGTGAGFYLDATVEPSSRHYKMDTYVTRELPRVVAEHFPASDVRGTFGQSMGGYGALTLSLKTPDLYASVSAFAPVSAPMRAPWEKKAFPGYLGADEELWREHDASELVRRRPFADGQTILVDQGTADEFLEEQLYPEVLEVACREAGQPLTLRWHEGYDTQLLHLDVHGGPRAPPRGGPGQHNLARRSSSARGRPSKNSKP